MEYRDVVPDLPPTPLDEKVVRLRAASLCLPLTQELRSPRSIGMQYLTFLRRRSTKTFGASSCGKPQRPLTQEPRGPRSIRTRYLAFLRCRPPIRQIKCDDSAPCAGSGNQEGPDPMGDCSSGTLPSNSPPQRSCHHLLPSSSLGRSSESSAAANSCSARTP